MNNSKKFFLVIVLLLLGASLIVTYAQSDARKETKEKLNKIEGDVSSIVIKTDDGEVEFTAEEAQYLFKKMKADKMIFSTHGDELIEIEHDIHMDEEGKITIIKKKGMDHGTTKKIKLEEEDGVKKATLTTTTDGKESVETYEGEEADKFLKEVKEEHGLSLDSEDIINLDHLKKSGGDEEVYIIKKFIDEDGNIEVNVTTGGDGEHVFIHKDSDHDIDWETEDFDGGIKKEVNVEVKDGVKTLTVTTTEDGEEKVEVFTGEEADEYLEKMHYEDDVDGKMKKMKKIRIEIEEEDDEENEND